MKKTIFSQDQVFWYLKRPHTECLRTDLSVDVAIIGGGMAGLSAAQSFAKKGKKVLLLEAYYCGAGASGKSSGFITPNSELGLADFIRLHGELGARMIWSHIESGVEHIRKNIKEYNLECDYNEEDSLEVANSRWSLKKIREEHESLIKLGFKTNFFSQEQLSSILSSKAYFGGVTYPGTFGINAFKYCQQMKDILVKEGVTIYEETPVLEFTDHEIITLHAKVKADFIVVCTDRFTPNFNRLTKEIYHIQNFLMISQQLKEHEIRALFPNKNHMVWDSDLLYSYYRISANRLLLGGGSLLMAYNKYEVHQSLYNYHKLTKYFQKKFPQITIQFEQIWPGMIGLSKDIAPIAGPDKKSPSIYYIAAAAGLPIAAMLGNYSAAHLVDGSDELKDYFSPYRSFLINKWLQTIIGTKLSFALSNFVTLKI
jgi:gamma-glutamylputrescine oxidase